MDYEAAWEELKAYLTKRHDETLAEYHKIDAQADPIGHHEMFGAELSYRRACQTVAEIEKRALDAEFGAAPPIVQGPAYQPPWVRSGRKA